MPEIINRMTEKALALNYFQSKDCTINLTRINYRLQQSHEYDLTEREHYHDFLELVFILSGQAVHVLEGNEYTVSAGDVFVLQGYQRHFFKEADSVELVNLMFDAIDDPNIITHKLRQLEGFKALFVLEPHYRATYRYRNMLQLTRDELAIIEIILNTMFAEQEQSKEGYEIILVNRFVELIILLSRYYSHIKTNRAKALLRISKVINYMENHYAENINVDILSERAYMSKRNFMRTFRGAAGLSPINYLKQIRLQKARKLLTETNLMIEEIAAQCGFSDSNYFIKCFRRAYKITPNKFRTGFR